VGALLPLPVRQLGGRALELPGGECFPNGQQQVVGRGGAGRPDETMIECGRRLAQVPLRLRDKYLAFAVAEMEWRPHHTVGHWDAIRVPINRLVPSRVLDVLHQLLSSSDRRSAAAAAAAHHTEWRGEAAGSLLRPMDGEVTEQLSAQLSWGRAVGVGGDDGHWEMWPRRGISASSHHR
jgi:hypothetical protein